MASNRHLRWVFATAAFVALWAMPSVALAHDGHAHRAPAVVETSPSATPDISATGFDASKDSQAEISFTVSVISSASGNPASGCVGGCCSSMAGMACCGGAIVPAMIDEPPVELSRLFDFDHVLPVHGLAPEALPKPPKSFA
jgi:hypothetical protein